MQGTNRLGILIRLLLLKRDNNTTPKTITITYKGPTVVLRLGLVVEEFDICHGTHGEGNSTPTPPRSCE